MNLLTFASLRYWGIMPSMFFWKHITAQAEEILLQKYELDPCEILK